MKPKDPQENRIGPVNPFALGTVFLEAAKKLGWVVEEELERHRRYYITPEGFTEMQKLGMDLQRVAHYRPMTPQAEAPPSRHERPLPSPGNAPMPPMRPRPPLHQQDQRQDRGQQRHHERQHDRQHGHQHGRRHDRHHDRHQH